MSGRIVHKSTASATSKQVNLAKAGIYLVKAGNKTARVAIK